MERIENNLKIDVDAIIKTANPKLYKKIPKFIRYLIKRIVHQNTCNYYLERYKYLQNLDFLREVFKDFMLTIEVKDENLVPKNESYIFVSNHPLGAFDGMIITTKLNEMFGESKIIVNEMLTYLSPIEDLFLGVKKNAVQTASYAKAIDELLATNTHLAIFPAGLSSRYKNWKLYDLEWKKTFLMKAKQSGRKIVPIYFKGRNSFMYHILGHIRSKLGIKFNLEMLLLPTEFFNTKKKTFGITFGSPITFQEAMENGDNDVKKAIEYVKKRCYDMRK